MIFGKNFIYFIKNNFTIINPCKFIHHKSHLKPFVSYLPCTVHREYFSIIFNAKKVCTILDKITVSLGNTQMKKKKLINIISAKKERCTIQKKFIKSVLSLFVQQLIIVFNYGRHDTQHNDI